MRTTLDLEDDVLLAAKSVAREEGRTLGQVVSDLARSALLARGASAGGAVSATAARLASLGITPLPHRGGIVTEELVHRLRDEEGV